MAGRGWERDDDFGARRGSAVAVSTEGKEEVEPLAPGGDSGASAAAPAPTRKKRKVLNESHLLSAEGLKKIARTFPYQVSGDVGGREAQALASLVKMYKQWAFDLYPGLNFEDFVERTEALGKAHGVQGLMADLRDKEMRRAQRANRDANDEEDDGDGIPREPDDGDGEEAML